MSQSQQLLVARVGDGLVLLSDQAMFDWRDTSQRPDWSPQSGLGEGVSSLAGCLGVEFHREVYAVVAPGVLAWRHSSPSGLWSEWAQMPIASPGAVECAAWGDGQGSQVLAVGFTSGEVMVRSRINYSDWSDWGNCATSGLTRRLCIAEQNGAIELLRINGSRDVQRQPVRLKADPARHEWADSGFGSVDEFAVNVGLILLARTQSAKGTPGSEAPQIYLADRASPTVQLVRHDVPLRVGPVSSLAVWGIAQEPGFAVASSLGTFWALQPGASRWRSYDLRLDPSAQPVCFPLALGNSEETAVAGRLPVSSGALYSDPSAGADTELLTREESDEELALALARGSLANTGRDFEPLADDDPAEIHGIQLIHRIPGGQPCTRKYVGADKAKRIRFVKVLQADATPAQRDLFLKEIGACRKLQNAPEFPQFVGSSLGGPEGPAYLVQQFIQGEDVAKLIKTGGPLLPRDALAVAAVSLAALRRLHDLKLAHGDIKPANIVLGKGVACVTDLGSVQKFGVADLIAGSPAYSPPEHKYGAVSAEGDLYSWAVTVTEAFTGSRVGDLRSVPSKELRDVLRACLLRREERPSVDDCEAAIAAAMEQAPTTPTQSQSGARTAAPLIARLRRTDVSKGVHDYANPLTIFDRLGSLGAVPHFGVLVVIFAISLWFGLVLGASR